jgi:hypothetical protein
MGKASNPGKFFEREVGIFGGTIEKEDIFYHNGHRERRE